MNELLSLVKEISAKMNSELPNLGKFRGGINEDAKEAPSYRQIKEIIQIKLESPFSGKINEYIRNVGELRVYRDAGLKESEVNGKPTLIQKDIDPNLKDGNGVSNLDRMKEGKSPISGDGKPMELHHIGQKPDSPLAELTKTEHQQNYSELHERNESQIDRNKFNTEKENYWKERAKGFEKE